MKLERKTVLPRDNEVSEGCRIYAQIPAAPQYPHLTALWEDMAQRYLSFLARKKAQCAHLTFCVTQEDEERISLLFEAVRYEDGVPVQYSGFGQIADCRRDRLLPPAQLGLKHCQSAVLRGGVPYRVKNTFSNPQKTAIRYSELQKSVIFEPVYPKKEKKKRRRLLQGRAKRDTLVRKTETDKEKELL